ncbi:Transmembrane protein 160 [Larimichthys crocea]|uniref:Uncharacterized protein n=1 Tax=Larimichthys crocea TaxID=215358 RepID=A0ACD3QKI8_LARCR|nr:Transmembrane protein 160 [Larimichthys crocea]
MAALHFFLLPRRVFRAVVDQLVHEKAAVTGLVPLRPDSEASPASVRRSSAEEAARVGAAAGRREGGTVGEDPGAGAAVPAHRPRQGGRFGFLSWFRNGLLATGIGVIAFVQSEVGREAGYAFFILGGVCVSFGGASYIGSLFALRRMMLLSVPALLIQSAAVGTVALFWLCAISLYIGRLEVEIIHEDEEGEDEEECRECRERREHRGYRGSHDSRHQDSEDNGGKGPNK